MTVQLVLLRLGRFSRQGGSSGFPRRLKLSIRFTRWKGNHCLWLTVFRVTCRLQLGSNSHSLAQLRRECSSTRGAIRTVRTVGCVRLTHFQRNLGNVWVCCSTRCNGHSECLLSRASEHWSFLRNQEKHAVVPRTYLTLTHLGSPPDSIFFSQEIQFPYVHSLLSVPPA